MYPTTLAFELVLPEEPLAISLSHIYDQLHRLPDQRA